jgi:hypothetical protein
LAYFRHAFRHWFCTACKVPGNVRLKSLTIHHGRHTFKSNAMAGGRTPKSAMRLATPT